MTKGRRDKNMVLEGAPLALLLVRFIPLYGYGAESMSLEVKLEMLEEADTLFGEGSCAFGSRGGDCD